MTKNFRIYTLIALLLASTFFVDDTKAGKPVVIGTPNGAIVVDGQTGKYLGNYNANKYDPNSVANPYGRYGSRYNPESINNEYGVYGSPYSPYSINNPYIR